jgi:hypothetical protein
MLNQPYSGFKRIACSEPCVLEDAEGSREGVVWNLSVVGAYLVVRTVPREGETVQLSFSLPGDPAPINATARVVWANRPSSWPGCGESAVALPPGCGVQFTGLDTGALRRIEVRVRTTYPGAKPHPKAFADSAGGPRDEDTGPFTEPRSR